MTTGIHAKRVLVTGGSRGIGFAIAQRFLADGARVSLVDLPGSEVQEVAARLGHGAVGLIGDVTSAADIERAVADTVGAFGGLDVLVNNAGIAPVQPFIDSNAELFDRVMAVNARGSFLMTLACAPLMAETGGSIVQIASTCAFTAGASRNMSIYNMSKAAVRQMVASLASELAPRVRINAVAPGSIDTDMTRACLPDEASVAATVRKVPLAMLGQPSDIAAACAFLCSDDARYITGQTLVVDGGWLVR